MLTVKIKVCGITNLDDALAAIDMGADMLGFNFYIDSKRYIQPQEALAIIDKLPTFVDTTGVFVNPAAAEVRDIAGQGFLGWVQLHGDETPEFCDSLKDMTTRTIKAIRVKSPLDIGKAKEYFTDAVLFDAHGEGQYGGTGRTFDWSYIGNINKRIFLAGGITPENVIAAIEVGVYGIDVCSGIESSPGKKDHEKMKHFFENVRKVRG